MSTVCTPETVTVDRGAMFDVLVNLLRAETEITADSYTPAAFDTAVINLWEMAFGPMFRDCDLGLDDAAADAAGCACAACKGSSREAATPLYRLALERAGRFALEVAA